MPPHHQQVQKNFYDNFGANVKFVSKDVEHHIPAIYPQSSHWFYNPLGLEYDLHGDMLKHIFTNLKSDAIPESEWAPADHDWRNKGVLK